MRGGWPCVFRRVPVVVPSVFPRFVARVEVAVVMSVFVIVVICVRVVAEHG
jgi:hypothetical protein